MQALIELHTAYLKLYSEKLKSIRVLDPACGSGAFLNQVGDYLAEEGFSVWKSLLKLNNGQTLLGEWDGPEYNKEILRNNLFGVDLNKESVEITKLSLWLNTADANKTLTTLDENILCHNSIVSPDKAEDPLAMWGHWYPDIMSEGGFDIVIGNPPYTTVDSECKKYVSKYFETQQYNYDTYPLFIELSHKLTKKGGYIGLITPDTYFMNVQTPKIHEYLVKNATLLNIVQANVFEDANVYPIISIYKKELLGEDYPFTVITTPSQKIKTSNFMVDDMDPVQYTQKDLKVNDGFIFNYYSGNEVEQNLREKITSYSRLLSDVAEIKCGIKPYQQNKGYPKQGKDWGKIGYYESREKKMKLTSPIFLGKILVHIALYGMAHT